MTFKCIISRQADTIFNTVVLYLTLIELLQLNSMNMYQLEILLFEQNLTNSRSSPL